jgi:hypothetical protein
MYLVIPLEFFNIFLLRIFLNYISNAIPKVPHTLSQLPYPPIPTFRPWRSPVLGHIKFLCPMGLSFQWWPSSVSPPAGSKHRYHLHHQEAAQAKARSGYSMMQWRITSQAHTAHRRSHLLTGARKCAVKHFAAIPWETGASRQPFLKGSHSRKGG